MLDAKNLIKASLDVGRDFWRAPNEAVDRRAIARPRRAPLLVPIRSLGANHRGRILQHLLALEPQDRYLRFGYQAQDAQIHRYVESLNFERDEIFGIYNRKLELIAMAHLAYAQDERCKSCAEFGVSVSTLSRGRGYGSRLFDRAAMSAANEGVRLMFIHALTQNAAMLKIARNAGAVVEHDGTESEAYLQLPESTLDSHFFEILEEQVAQADYLIKVQAKQFWSFLALLQAGRRDTTDTQEPPPPWGTAAGQKETEIQIRYPRGPETKAFRAIPLVSESHFARIPDKEDKRTFLRKLAEFIHPGPDSTAELIETLAEAEDNQIIGAESRLMLEGVIRMADMTAGDVMVPATRTDMLNIQASLDSLLHTVIDTAHSRFPVYEGERENVIGILMAKDLLKLQRAPELNIRALLRPAVFVPESKGLNDLLRDFRGNRNHLAIVIDEFGRVAGLITIEDVLEQIVGEIEDEFDIAEDEGDIFALADSTYRVSGDTPIERVNDAFTVTLSGSDPDDQFDTIGGLIAHEMGHVPQRGERYTLSGLDFLVLHTKGGAVKWFKVQPTALANP